MAYYDPNPTFLERQNDDLSVSFRLQSPPPGLQRRQLSQIPPLVQGGASSGSLSNRRKLEQYRRARLEENTEKLNAVYKSISPHDLARVVFHALSKEGRERLTDILKSKGFWHDSQGNKMERAIDVFRSSQIRERKEFAEGNFQDIEPICFFVRRQLDTFLSQVQSIDLATLPRLEALIEECKGMLDQDRWNWLSRKVRKEQDMIDGINDQVQQPKQIMPGNREATSAERNYPGDETFIEDDGGSGLHMENPESLPAIPSGPPHFKALLPNEVLADYPQDNSDQSLSLDIRLSKRARATDLSEFTSQSTSHATSETMHSYQAGTQAESAGRQVRSMSDGGKAPRLPITPISTIYNAFETSSSTESITTSPRPTPAVSNTPDSPPLLPQPTPALRYELPSSPNERGWI